MNTQLIADAVRNSRGEAEATVWDRLFAFWFRRLVYTQIWEDPEADLAALQLPLASTIVTISSGGCNALSYLTAGVCRRPQCCAPFAAQAQAVRAAGFFQLRRILAVLRRGHLALELPALSRAIAP